MAEIDIRVSGDCLTGRNIIAFALNSGRFPVIGIDLTKIHSKDTYGKVGKAKVFWEYNGEPCAKAGDVEFTRNPETKELEYEIGSSGTCITDSFTWSDIKEMYDNANLPVVHTKSRVVMFFYDEESIHAEFDAYGLLAINEVKENYPFYLITCKK